MNPVIPDLRALAGHDFSGDDESKSLFDQLIQRLRRLPTRTDAEQIDELLERADAYDGSQPSFAADLRAAATSEAN